jgi:hypothetical protein
MVVEVNMTKVRTLEEHLEMARLKIVHAMKYGRTLAVLLANSCPPFKSKFNAPETLPLDIFDAGKVLSVRGLTDWAGLWPEKVREPHPACPSFQ